tara:strand:+ start:27036 stop:27254 length:219 start_codon:yes stop_codon:yes gene_type:complete
MDCGVRHELMADIDRVRYRQCPKCGRQSLPFGIAGTGAMIQHLVMENAKLKSAIFDLECEAQERAEPGVTTT